MILSAGPARCRYHVIPVKTQIICVIATFSSNFSLKLYFTFTFRYILQYFNHLDSECYLHFCDVTFTFHGLAFEIASYHPQLEKAVPITLTAGNWQFPPWKQPVPPMETVSSHQSRYDITTCYTSV